MQNDGSRGLAMREFSTEQMSPNDVYKLLSGSVVPRPIAWVSTVSEQGVPNLAPYSFFTAVSAHPPTLLFCAARRKAQHGLRSTKDTLDNIRATGEFVVNIVSEETAEAMNQTAAELTPSADEFVHAGLTPAPSQLIRPPRVAEARVQMECRLQQLIENGQEAMGACIVIGSILMFHIAEQIVDADLHIDPDQLRAIGRLSGSAYARTRDRFAMIRPK